MLAPRGRDSQVIVQVLQREGVACEPCRDLAGLWASLVADPGAVLLTEEALAGDGLDGVLDWCDAQPAWSDLPVIVLATKQPARRTRLAAGLLERLGNTIILERPINAETLTSAAGSALRARRRQYQARGLFLERERTERELRVLNETLEQRVEERARQLDRASETLAFALDAAGMGSWDLDLRTDIARCSPQHDRIFGHAAPQPGWGLARFLAHVLDEDRAAAAAAFERAAKEGALDIECRIRRTDEAVRWVSVKGRVTYDAAGRAVRVAGIVTDTTERRHTEDALRQAQKMEAIGQLTGGVAHDFNNLLTVIVGALDMVIRAPERTERVVRLSEAAMNAARRGEQLTQQLLAFSRRRMLHPRTLNPNRLLRAFETLARRAVGETVELRFELDPDTGPVHVDPAQFEAAVLNLIVNARDAMPQGGIVRVRGANVACGPDILREHGLPPGAYVEISIADTGSGIDAATLAHVFEPFFTTKEVGKGSGLGLSQVYGFARAAGGYAVIDSTPGRGTTVGIRLPRSTRALHEEALPTPALPLSAAESGETVLLVEDDAQVLGMALESLGELRYNVMVACNAAQALAHLNSPDRIDVLFSDVVMPGGMDGLQLAVEARRLRPQLKILLTSGYAGDRAAQPPAGLDVPILDKPYRRDELARKLRLVLGS